VKLRWTNLAVVDDWQARERHAACKKLENHCHALARYFFFCNFCRVHKMLVTTPAMVVGVTDRTMRWKMRCRWYRILPGLASV